MQKAIEKYNASGKPVWEFFEDWIKSMAALAARRGVTLELERQRVGLPGSNPVGGVAYYDHYDVRSSHFPGAVYRVPGAIYMALDGDEDALEDIVLLSLSLQSGVPVPPLPDDSPKPIPPADPVGEPLGVPGWFNPAPGDQLAAGAVFWRGNIKFVKRNEQRGPFIYSYWERVTV